ncbi:hypothetical protein [Streptomyces sp. NPDC051561]|uniref:hypothetical protein n=1 Tax=Streptomyces sp. NPDC051561 TaxID=3365658 RepID=UPI0037BB1849
MLTDGMLERSANSLDQAELIVRTRDLHPREAARTLIAAIVKANNGHSQDDATVMRLDRHGTARSQRDADTGPTSPRRPPRPGRGGRSRRPRDAFIPFMVSARRCMVSGLLWCRGCSGVGTWHRTCAEAASAQSLAASGDVRQRLSRRGGWQERPGCCRRRTL